MKSCLELKTNECKYPVNFDPEVQGLWLFCAEATVPGEVYCKKHKAVCATVAHYRPATPKR